MVWSYRLIRLIKRAKNSTRLAAAPVYAKSNKNRSNGISTPNYYPKKVSYIKENDHLSTEIAPLKELPTAPGDDLVDNSIAKNSSIKPIVKNNSVSAEKTNVVYIVNGNCHQGSNLSGNTQNMDPNVMFEEIVPSVPKRLSSIRRSASSVFQREAPPPPVPDHLDESHISNDSNRSSAISSQLPRPPTRFTSKNTRKMTDERLDETTTSQFSHDSPSAHDTSSEVIDIDEAIGINKVTFQLPNGNSENSRHNNNRYFLRDQWIGKSPFHNVNTRSSRPQSPSTHQYQEIGEVSSLSSSQKRGIDGGQWSSADDKSLDGISSDVSSPMFPISFPNSSLLQGNSNAAEGSEIAKTELKKVNIQIPSDQDTNQISYGYENVLPLSRLPNSPSGSSVAPSSVFSSTSEEDEFDLDSDFGPNSRFKRRIKTEQKDMPIVVFPKRKQSSSRSFQFSLPTKRFQRVMDSDPRHFFSRSMSSSQKTSKDEQGSRPADTRTQRGRNMGNYRNKQNRSTRTKGGSTSWTQQQNSDTKNDMDITFDEKDEDEYIKNKQNNSTTSLHSMPSISESYTYEKTISSKKITETRI